MPFFLDQYGHKKFIFEYIQTELEECTENLSQIVARPHLHTATNKLLRLTAVLRRKRAEFLTTVRASASQSNLASSRVNYSLSAFEQIRSGLNSFNDTPPALKRFSLQRWKYLLKDNIQHDDEFKNAVAVSLKELNPRNPWIVDKKGRHTNLLALLNDLPALEEELNSILVPSKDKGVGLCARWDCSKCRLLTFASRLSLPKPGLFPFSQPALGERPVGLALQLLLNPLHARRPQQLPGAQGERLQPEARPRPAAAHLNDR